MRIIVIFHILYSLNPTKMAIYFFSRLSIKMEDANYIQKLEYLYNQLGNGKPITYRKDVLKIINISIRKVGNKSFLTGNIIKYAPQHLEKILSSENKIEDVVLNNHLLANVRFIIDANEMMFMFQEDKSHIPKKYLPSRFIDLLKENAGSNWIPVSIAPITDTYTFFDKIKEIKQIKKIVIQLTPSNPNNRDRWKKTDEKLKRDNITDYKEILENKVKGGSIIVDEETNSKIMMGEDGYGSAMAEGFDGDGKPIKITTESAEAQAKSEVITRDNIEDEINSLQDKVREIKSKPDAQST